MSSWLLIKLKVCQDYLNQRREAARAWETDEELGVALFGDEDDDMRSVSSYDKNRKAKEQNDLAIYYAQTIEGEIQNELAVRLCVSVQNLPLEERFPVFKEAIQLWEAAEENGYRECTEEKEKIIKTIGHWYYDEAHKKSMQIDQSIYYLKKALSS